MTCDPTARLEILVETEETEATLAAETMLTIEVAASLVSSLVARTAKVPVELPARNAPARDMAPPVASQVTPEEPRTPSM